MPPRRETLARLVKAARMALSSRQYFGYSLKLIAGCITPTGRAAFRRNLHSLALPPVGRVDYPAWIADRVRRRSADYPLPTTTPGMFSFLTTVYETKGRYVLDLYESVRAQTCGDFEWVLLDNGSTKPDTLAAIEQIKRDPRVRHERVEQNLGILGGIATCLRRATGRYVVPLDSDDLLTPDALQVFAAVIARAAEQDGEEPPLLYSDEDKCRETPAPFEAYHKPDWDPVLFWNNCYIAHLGAIRRDLAAEFGYTDDRAKGCHDWDTFFRFLRHGRRPRHVPEIVYSWRIHPQSCAGNIFSKSYVHDSHRHVLASNLALQPAAARHELRQSPLFADTPDWWIARRREQPPPLCAVHLVRADEADPRWLREQPLLTATARACAADPHALARAVERLRAHDPQGRGLTLLCCDGAAPRDDEGFWDAIGLCERFPDTAVVGGRLTTDDDVIWSAGEVFGYHGIAGTPDRGRQALDPGYFAWLRKQRSCSSVHAAFCLVRTDFLREFVALGHPASLGLLGAWLGAHAAATRRRVVFTPMLAARVPGDAPASENAPREEQALLLQRYPDLLAYERAYSRHLGLEPFDAYAAVYPAAREQHLRALHERLFPTNGRAARA
jgi:hypothetical protein